MKLRRCTLLLALLLSPGAASATEYSPWLGEVYEFRFGTDYSYEYYPHLQTPDRHLWRHHSHNNNLHFCLGVSPAAYWDTEVEAQLASTSESAFFFDYFKWTGRYNFLDDVTGDCISLTAGASLSLVNKKALRDFSTLHQGEAELDLHVAIGKEISKGARWLWHPWGVVGCTVANHPYPGFHGIVMVERNFEDIHVVNLFSKGNIGMGGKDLSSRREFDGYGPIQYRSIDLGATYSYALPLWGKLSVEYTYRLFAHNYPERNQRITVAYLLPFSFY